MLVQADEHRGTSPAELQVMFDVEDGPFWKGLAVELIEGDPVGAEAVKTCRMPF